MVMAAQLFALACDRRNRAPALLPPFFRPKPHHRRRLLDQALIEMFLGQSADHLQKHLPDVTRRTSQTMDTGNGQSLLTEFSMFASQAKAAGAGFPDI